MMQIHRVVLNFNVLLLIALVPPGALGQSIRPEAKTQTNSLAFTPPTTASHAKVGSTQLLGEFGLLGNGYSNGIDQSLGTGFGFDLVLKHELATDLQFVVDAGFVLTSGYSQYVYVDNSSHPANLILNEASLNWAPARSALLSFGTLNQSFLDDAMFMGPVSFPGAKQTLKFANGGYYVRLTAEEAIPTSSTTTPVTTQSDGLPTFLLGRIKVGYVDPRTLTIAAWASYFQFEHLPGQVANESRLQGNTVTGLGAPGAQFAYEFAGLESGANLRYAGLGSDVVPLLSTHFVYNTQAPEGHDRAIVGGGGLEIRTGPNARLTPSYELFRIESDASPAFYTVAWYGHANAQGGSALLNFELRQSRVNLEARYSAGTLITATPFQNNFSLLSLTARKSYDFL